MGGADGARGPARLIIATTRTVEMGSAAAVVNAKMELLGAVDEVALAMTAMPRWSWPQALALLIRVNVDPE